MKPSANAMRPDRRRKPPAPRIPRYLCATSPAIAARAAAYRCDPVAVALAGKILTQLPHHSLDEPHLRAWGAQLVARLDAGVSSRERDAA